MPIDRHILVGRELYARDDMKSRGQGMSGDAEFVIVDVSSQRPVILWTPPRDRRTARDPAHDVFLDYALRSTRYLS